MGANKELLQKKEDQACEYCRDQEAQVRVFCENPEGCKNETRSCVSCFIDNSYCLQCKQAFEAMRQPD